MYPDMPPPGTEQPAGDAPLRGFRVYEIKPSVRPGSRRDYYKICVLTGRSLLRYGDRTVELTGTSFLFFNSHLPYAAQLVSTASQTGYACLFSDEFLTAHDPTGLLRQSPLFAACHAPLFTLTSEQGSYVAGIFQRMLEEQRTTYRYKNYLVYRYCSC